MIIEIGLKPEAYTPEAFAYKEHLEKKGQEVRLCKEKHMSPDSDIRIYFMGTRPFWKHGINEIGCVVHEYQSLSIPPKPKLKNLAKKLINSQPSGRIFLNRSVKSELALSENTPYIFRDMGVSKSLYNCVSKNPEYDLIYCGTVDNRPGLFSYFHHLADIGFRILVVGQISDQAFSLLKENNHIHLAGRLSRKDLPQAFSKARAGLNYTPDIYPFNIQTSTKTLEYCAAGLGLVSNRYQWVNEFCSKEGIKPLWLEEISHKRNFDNFEFSSADLSHYEWEYMLDNAGLMTFLEHIYNSQQ